MIRFLLIIIFLIALKPIMAQDYIPFPDANAQWISGKYFTYYPDPSYSYTYHQIIGDTIINNKKYTIIGNEAKIPQAYLRDDSGKIYLTYNSSVNNYTESLLYDFTLKEGDTVMLPLFPGQPYESYVTKVDSVLIGGLYRKTIYIDSWIDLKFVEGIGSMQGLFYNEIPWVDWGGILSCFSLNDSIYGASILEGKCFYPTGIENRTSKNLIITPNPTKGNISVDGEFEKIEVFDIWGIKQREFNSSSYSIKELPSGIYHLMIYYKNNDNRSVVKIIKVD